MKTLKLNKPALIAALGLAALGLGGCGFAPLYAIPGVSPKLASIEVSRPDGRTGYLMGQFLDDDFGKDTTQRPLYRLLLQTRETRIPRGIRVNNVASRYEVQLSTTYTLININTRQPITKGVVQVNVSYDSADQPYAGIAAELDGQQRAAEQAAERIRLELASYFASPRPTTGLLAVGDPSLSTYSERLQPATVLSPRERAMGQPTAQNNNGSILGGPIQDVTPGASTAITITEPTDTPGTAAPLLDPYANGANPALDNAPLDPPGRF